MMRWATMSLACLIAVGIGSGEVRSAVPEVSRAADQVPRIVIPRSNTSDGPEVGRPSLPWSGAARVGRFLSTNGDSLEAYPTWVEMTYDDQALRVRFRCEGPSGDRLKTEVEERDGPVWRDDSVELLLCPSDAPRPLYHFIVNAAGVTYEAEGIDKSWDANWSAQTAQDSQGWSVSMAIPFEALAPMAPPEAGDTWRINFCRNDHQAGKKKRSIWSPTRGALQIPTYYGRVEFGDAGTPPVRFARVDPVVIGDNLLRVEAPGMRYELAVIGKRGDSIRLGRRRIPQGGDIPFRLDDDEIRRVALSVFDPEGGRLAYACYPMASPAILATVRELEQQLAEIDRQLERLPEAAREKTRAVVSEVRPRLRVALALANDAEQRNAKNWDRLAPIVAEMKRVMDGPAGLARTRSLFPQASFAVGLAGPMQKIMIQGYAFAGWYDNRYELKLARNEHEGFQVVVMPYPDDLANVSVSVSPLVNRDGGEVMRGETEVSLVGHVDVDDNTRYEVEHHGWWPDPLLNFQKSCDVRAGDHVAFWIDVATRADTRPGDYRATVTVAADGCAPIELDLDVHVWDFELIDGTHLRNAFTYNEGPVGRFYPDRWDAAMRRKYHDLILDHRLNIDHLYRHTPPGIELLEYARTKGQNAFNVGAVFRQDAKGRELEELRRYVSELKKRDLFQFAYVYGFDEVKSEKFAEMREVFGRVHEQWPGLETMTTAIDHSYGRESGLRDVVDIWVPLTDWYDIEEARQLRSEGRKVWWYICVVPEHPYANWFIEYPAIEARLLMGAMSYKYQVDGFLYYLINLWTGNHRPIASGPYTNWDPGSFVNEEKDYVANGDGSLICPGPDGPLSTIRLENIRDGLEDYEYLYLLAERREQVRRLPAGAARRDYLARVDTLLTVPSCVVQNLVEYTRDPGELYAFRDRLAEAILEADDLIARRAPAR